MQESRYNASLDILKAGAMEQKGEECRLSNFMGAVALSDLVKTTLGPKGMDKILQSTGGGGRGKAVHVTNDGATILKNIVVDNPAAKILIDISKTQDEEVGDGTTTVCVLAGELLRQAEKLIMVQQIHPQVIIDGWREAAKVARDALEKSAVNNFSDETRFKEDLLNIARTTLSSKVLSLDRDHFAELAVNAVLRLGETPQSPKGVGKRPKNLELISVMKKLGGTMADSYLEDGFLLDKKIGIGQPKTMKDAKILVANTSMDTDKIKIFGAHVKTDNVDTVAAIEKAEKQRMKDKVDKIMGFKCNCFINRQLIYNYPEELFANAGMIAIEHADFDGIERLASALGGEVVSQFDDPEGVKLGECKLIEEVMIGEDTAVRFSGLKGGQACTIVLRGSSQQLLDEAERSLNDALCIVASTVRDTRVVFGAGCSESLMANAVRNASATLRSKEELLAVDKRSFGKAKAMDAFATALNQIPLIIGESAGMSAQFADDLEQIHARSEFPCRQGLDINNNTFMDVEKAGVTESFLSKSSSLEYASEAAEMILRVDDIIRCAPRQRK